MNGSDILIVSASTGTGHVRAAEALKEAFLDRPGDRRVEHVDLLELAPRWVRTALSDGYEILAAHAPWLWRHVYHRTDRPVGSAPRDPARWEEFGRRVLFAEFRRLLASRPWGRCVATHFLPVQFAAGAPGAPPFSLVVTDMTLHAFWAWPRVGRYFVAHESIARALRSRMPDVRVEEYGIPVSPRFASPIHRDEAVQSFGLDPRRPVALVMDGGLGLEIEATLEAALRARVRGLQILGICGRNDAAANRLRAIYSHFDPGMLRVAGFVDDIERHIAAADLVVTKPGGLTTSEALAMGKPLLLTRPIPGQEEGNARVLVEAGAGVTAFTAEEVTRELERLFKARVLLEELACNARRLGRPDAASRIASAIDGMQTGAAAA